MPYPLKPPRGAFIPTSVLFHPDLTPSLRDTLVQLLALAWRSGGRATPPMSLEMLSQVTGKPVGTLRGHLTALRTHFSALRLQSAGDGTHQVIFAEDFCLPRRSARPAEISEDFDELRRESSEMDSLNLVNPALNLNQTVKKPKARPKRKAAAPCPTPEMPPELRSALLTAGVFPGLLEEVARSDYSPLEIQALLDWTCADHPAQPAGIFMVRLRAGTRPPTVYLQPACPICGQRGGHASGCSRAYVDGPYSQFIEH